MWPQYPGQPIMMMPPQQQTGLTIENVEASMKFMEALKKTLKEQADEEKKKKDEEKKKSSGSKNAGNILQTALILFGTAPITGPIAVYLWTESALKMLEIMQRIPAH